ncbi:MAG: hypothetical protein ABH879_05870 [archaeon]
MLNKRDFADIERELEQFDAIREEAIKQCRVVLKASKQAIYCVHRNELKEAGGLLSQAGKVLSSLRKAALKNPKLEAVGAMSEGMQEYAEAMCYLDFVRNKKIPTRAEVGANSEDYLMGLCDLTGELARRAVMSAAGKNNEDVETIRALVDEIYGEFIKFNLRNGDLRRKSDSIKWNLKKVEEIVYDLKK